MITNLFDLIKNAFWITPWVMMPCILIGFAITVFMVIVTIIFILDSSDRSISKMPYNIILDRIIPLMAILTPMIIIFSLDIKNVSWIEYFTYIILIHIVILLPSMYFWSKHRLWTNTDNAFKSWGSPQLLFDLSIAIIYPALWGFGLHYIRYLRLGNELDLTKYINNDILSILTVCFFLLPFSLTWIKLFLILFVKIKTLFKQTFTNFIMSIILFLLRYKIIFNLLEKAYQVSFLWITFVICHPDIYPKKSFLRKQLHLLYVGSPYKLWLCLGLGCALEIIYTKGKLHYSLYALLIFFTLHSIIKGLNALSKPANTWVETCCYANYINYNWVDAYYPRKFWLSFNDMRAQFNYFPPLSVDQQTHLEKIIHTWELKDDKMRNRDYHIFMRLIEKPNTSFKHRVRLVYFRWTKIN